MRSTARVREWETYADGTGNTLVLPDALLAILDLGNTLLADLLHAHVLLAAPELRGIDGNEEALHAALLGVLDVLLGDLAVAVDVTSAPQSKVNRRMFQSEEDSQLQEERLAGSRRVDDVVERARCEGRDLITGYQRRHAALQGTQGPPFE